MMEFKNARGFLRLRLSGLFLCCLLVMAFLSGCSPSTPSPSGQSTVTPSPTSTQGASTVPSANPSPNVPATSAGAMNAAQGFYQFIKAQNYAQAYDTYIDPAATLTISGVSQRFSRAAFVQAAQQADLLEGKVTDYSAFPDSSNPTLVVMTLSRVRNLRYHSHLQTRQEAGGWKVVSLDTL